MSSNTQHRIMLAGGGTAGHVNPLLAVADAIRRLDPDADIIALGTAVGLEADLVPQAGYQLETIEKVPFPADPTVRRWNFPANGRRRRPRWWSTLSIRAPGGRRLRRLRICAGLFRRA